jgi:hypothetical protein
LQVLLCCLLTKHRSAVVAGTQHAYDQCLNQAGINLEQAGFASMLDAQLLLHCSPGLATQQEVVHQVNDVRKTKVQGC